MSLLPYTIQILLFLFIIYFLLSIKVSNQYRHQMNAYLLLILMVLSILALRGAYVEHVVFATFGIILLGMGMWFFLLQISKDQLSVHTPTGYLSFYFLILFIVLITGNSLSLLFPEIFILAVIFGVTNAGRKVSFAISLMAATTIGLLYLHEPVSTDMFYRVGLMIVLLVTIPQVSGYIYKKKVEAARKQLYFQGENS